MSGRRNDFRIRHSKDAGNMGLDVSAVLMDKEFHSIDVLREAQKSGMRCLVPAVRYQSVCRAMEEFVGNRSRPVLLRFHAPHGPERLRSRSAGGRPSQGAP